LRYLLEEWGDILHPETRLYLHEASRSELIHKFILPNLRLGKVVICDRYALSAEVYQGVIQGVDGKLLRSIHNRVYHLCAPNITFLLDVSPRIALSRLIQRGDEMVTWTSESLDYIIRQYQYAAGTVGALVVNADSPKDVVLEKLIRGLDFHLPLPKAEGSLEIAPSPQKRSTVLKIAGTWLLGTLTQVTEDLASKYNVSGDSEDEDEGNE
jgi:thymidylate kinase